jgi:hypothetical protein
LKERVEMQKQVDIFHDFLVSFSSDQRLNVWHLAMMFGICMLATPDHKEVGINISRARLMAVSHIKDYMTYHKYLKELQQLGFIKYVPSYHPGIRSKIWLLI